MLVSVVRRLNILAEVTEFGDREFYRDWWNAQTVEEVGDDCCSHSDILWMALQSRRAIKCPVAR